MTSFNIFLSQIPYITIGTLYIDKVTSVFSLTMRLWLLSVLVTCLTVDGTYMPGSPGGAWTREEILTVKAKLRYPQLRSSL